MTLTDAQWDSMQRIAGFCATRHRGEAAFITFADLRDAALDGVVEEIAENGWPDSDTVLFRVGGAAAMRAVRESRRHLLHARAHWSEPPGSDDRLAEQVTDRVAVHQLTWALSEGEWSAVWATAEVMKRDGRQPEAAALLGISVPFLKLRLSQARKRCRALWIAPGETPPARKYSSVRADGSHSKAANALRSRNRRQRRAAA